MGVPWAVGLAGKGPLLRRGFGTFSRRASRRELASSGSKLFILPCFFAADRFAPRHGLLTDLFAYPHNTASIALLNHWRHLQFA